MVHRSERCIPREGHSLDYLVFMTAEGAQLCCHLSALSPILFDIRPSKGSKRQCISVYSVAHNMTDRQLKKPET